MEDFKKFFSGLQRDYGFCNVENGYIDPDSGKLKFDPAIGGGVIVTTVTDIVGFFTFLGVASIVYA